jgi:UDP-glucose 4-epimerase
MSIKNIAIIGSNGFIGSHLAETLLRKNDYHLFLFGNSKANILSGKLPYTKIDLNDGKQVAKNFATIDLVYYLASASIPSSSWNNPLLELEKNLIPFVNFLEAISILNVQRVVFVSSAGTVYGNSQEKVTENSNKLPYSPYGITKLTMEFFLNHYKVKNNLNFDVFRVSNIYGSGQNTSKGLGIINTFLEKIIEEKQVQVFGNGENIRNYVYIKDVVELLCLSANSQVNKSSIYNLASNDALSINELVAKIKNIVPENFEIVNKSARQSDYPATYIDNSKLLGSFPDFKFTPLDEGIKQTYLDIKNAKNRQLS